MSSGRTFGMAIADLMDGDRVHFILVWEEQRG
jgi:hypothetical protein